LGRISIQNKNKREKIDYKNIKFLNNEEKDKTQKEAKIKETKPKKSKKLII